MSKCPFKCGDIVRNHWAGDINPTKYFVFIKNNGKVCEVIDFDGKRLRKGSYYTDDLAKGDGKFEKIGHLDLIGFLKTPLVDLLNKDGTIERWNNMRKEREATP